MSDAATIMAAKLRMTMDLFDLAKEMKLQTLKRRHPDETEEQIRDRLRRWVEKHDEPLECPPGFRRRAG